ncbi:ATP-binding cassette domain-containing protein [Granulicella sp. dw_53]|uniref:methionine ABC transporter ATP-binding protein n=1 Tax=Granulicella sp. dw_53 TaxID=2719792 RepID=UPI001BD3B5F5
MSQFQVFEDEGAETPAATLSAPDIQTSRPFAISLRGLSKSYRDGMGIHHALDGVNLSLEKGAIHGILGASGAGKTTLLRCLLRLERADAGEVLIEGCNWNTLSDMQLRRERHRVGVIFQHLHLLASRTAAENISLPLEIAGIRKRDREARVAELLEWFGISDKGSEYPAKLSGGQRQRVALARALATAPAILLADEPTSALDTETKLSVLNVLRRIRDEFGVTVLIITHDLQAAEYVCDTLSILSSGRIVESGPTAEVIDSPQTDEARRLFAPSSSPEERSAKASLRGDL